MLSFRKKRMNMRDYFVGKGVEGGGFEGKRAAGKETKGDMRVS
jgi:hypothetical protein